MNKVDLMLRKEKAKIDELSVPEDMDIRLRKALENRRRRKHNKIKWQIKAAAIILTLLITGYHVDTLAYYYKQLIGYDNVMNGTLKELNQSGKGQTIGKSYTFENGIVVTLDGIMLDENQLLVFYTIKDPSGNVDDIDVQVDSVIYGRIGRYNMNHGQGERNKDNTEIKWMSSFETPYFFEKTLKFSFYLRDGNNSESGEIIFKLNRNQAMSSLLKKQINRTIEVDETTILFKSITASPTVTSIEGEIQGIFGLVMDRIKDRRFIPHSLEIKLIANGKELSKMSSGMSTGAKGITFHSEFDTLPADLKELQIELVKFSAYHKVDSTKTLSLQEANEPFSILGQKILFENIYEANGETLVTITTDESVVLTEVYLEIDNNLVELEKTTNSQLTKESNGEITHTRTLTFKGTGEELKFKVKQIKYDKFYNKIIDVPI